MLTWISYFTFLRPCRRTGCRSVCFQRIFTRGSQKVPKDISTRNSSHAGTAEDKNGRAKTEKEEVKHLCDFGHLRKAVETPTVSTKEEEKEKRKTEEVGEK